MCPPIIFLKEEKNMTMKDKILEKGRAAKKWAADHKEEIAIYGPLLINGAVEIVKIVMKKKIVNEEKHLKENYIYERSGNLGHYYEIQRKLSASEWLQVEERKDHGESLASILLDMRVLK